jgi:mono/diheme cytochrome c family protein
VSSQADSSSQGNAAPVVSFGFPKDGDTLVFGSSINVSLSVEDPNNQIASILLSLNGQSLAILNDAPFVWPSSVLTPLQNLVEGSYLLSALLTDSFGQTSLLEASFNVLPNTPPSAIAFIAPAPNLELPVGSSLDVLAEVTDSRQITSMTLTINGQLIGTDSNAPFGWRSLVSTLQRNLAAGEHRLVITATDNLGRISEAINVVRVSDSARVDAGDPAWGSYQYQQQCLTCHGSYGEGTNRAPALVPVKEIYSNSGQDYSLFELINDLMPVGTPTGCTGQCARDIASYISGPLVTKNADYSNLMGDSVTGRIEYNVHCSLCHGLDALGGTEDVPLLPVKEGAEYPLSSFYIFARADIFSVIDLGMPVDNNGFPEELADNCSAQCAVDVLAYLRQLDADLTDQQRLELRAASGQTYYENMCLGCHGATGTRQTGTIPAIIPLTDSQRNNDSLDDNDILFVINRDTMPTTNPGACIGYCAEDVSIYIREVLDQ